MDGWDGFGVKIDPKVTKTITIDTCLPEVVVFAGKKTPEATWGGSTILVTKLLRSCDEVAQDSHEVAEKSSSNDP